MFDIIKYLTMIIFILVYYKEKQVIRNKNIVFKDSEELFNFMLSVNTVNMLYKLSKYKFA